MSTLYRQPILSKHDASLPIYVVTADKYSNNKVDRPYGIPHNQLLFTVNGTGTIHYNNKKYSLTQDSLLILNKNEPQLYRPVENWVTMWITYATNFYNASFNLPSGVHIIDNIDKYKRLTEEIISYNKDSNFVFKTSHLIYNLILELSAELNKTRVNKTHLVDVYEYIQTHFYEPLDLTTLSALSGFSSEYLSRLYKKNYRMSPISHVHKLRIQNAKELLITTDYSVSYISRSVGYNSHSHFSSLFKKYEGMTPEMFRTTHKPKY